MPSSSSMNKGMLPMMQSPIGMIMMPMMRSSNVANLFNIINKQQRGQGSSHNHTFSSAGINQLRMSKILRFGLRPIRQV
eukprot:scaffold232_cov203-Alexandrium_tamarense.AAC.10